MKISLLLAVGLLGAALQHPLMAQTAGRGPGDPPIKPISNPPCPSTGIRTDPQAPYHPDPTKTNNFNWYQGTLYSGRQYALNSPAINQTSIWLPWEQPNNVNMERILGKRDKPTDGWELVRRDLGFDNANNPIPGTRNPYIILYNKYQGMLRVFVAVGDRRNDYQFAEIKLVFSDAANKKAGTLNRQMALGVALEDTEPGLAGEFAAVATYLNDSGMWFMADFPMDYDPCVCLFDSKLKVSVRLIEQANVRLEGESKGNLFTTAAGGASTKGSSYDKGIPFIRKVNDAISAGGKTYNSIDKLTTTLTGKKGSKAAPISALKSAIQMPSRVRYKAVVS
jgi:hypothetical protein